jgi:hypothetical protein
MYVLNSAAAHHHLNTDKIDRQTKLLSANFAEVSYRWHVCAAV